MSIGAVAKSLAKELISTKEYQMMRKKKQELYTHPQIGEHAKNYEAKQLSIMKMKSTPAKRQSLLSDLSKEYQPLMSTKEMKEYVDSIAAFQKKTFSIFQLLNTEMNKIITG